MLSASHIHRSNKHMVQTSCDHNTQLVCAHHRRSGMRGLRFDWADMYLWAVEDVWQEFDLRR
jgi:hypothetical protein